MQLSNALFEQIVATLNAPPSAMPEAPAGEGQRRREQRVGVRAEVTVIPLTDTAAPFSVPVRDVSPGGIGFYHSAPIALDEQFVVMLPQENDVLAVLCQVAHYQPLAARVFAVGARFVRVLRDAAGEAGPAAPQVSSRAA